MPAGKLRLRAGELPEAAVGDATTSYVFDTNGALPLLLTDGSRKYVYGPQGLAYSVDTANNIAVYHTDGLGSIRALTNGSGTLIQTYQTDAFGAPTGSQGTSTQPFGFTGQQQDTNGLLYLRARYYDPATGRFLSRDVFGGSVADPSSLNRYTYAENNPGLDTDASGRCIEDACVVETIVVIAVVAAAVGTWFAQHHASPPAIYPPVAAPSTASASGSPMGTPGPFTSEETRRHALGTDESGQYRPAEEQAGVDLEDVLGQRLQRFNSSVNPYKAGDWFDANGTTYDAVGPVPSSYFDLAGFTNQIDRHLLKQGVDKVFVDLNGLTADQGSAVRDYINNLPADQQARIITYP